MPNRSIFTMGLIFTMRLLVPAVYMHFLVDLLNIFFFLIKPLKPDYC